MTVLSTTGSPPAVPSSAVRPVDPAQYRPGLVNVGAIVWLASELMFFSGLFAAYFSIRAGAKVWPPKGDTLDVTSVLVATILLVLSSGTMQMGVRRAVLADRRGFLGWLALTFALGALFDGMQLSDYVGRPFAISTDAYGSCFYVLTGFHALHVLGGLAGMVLIGARAWRTRHFGHSTVPAIEFLSYYWHFVDVVWIALFAVIFLLQ